MVLKLIINLKTIHMKMTEKKLSIFGGDKVEGSLSFENVATDC